MIENEVSYLLTARTAIVIHLGDQFLSDGRERQSAEHYCTSTSSTDLDPTVAAYHDLAHLR